MKKIKVEGMSCRHCALAVQKTLEEIDGVENVNVDLEKGEAVFDETKDVSMDVVRERIKKAGYKVV